MLVDYILMQIVGMYLMQIVRIYMKEVLEVWLTAGKLKISNYIDMSITKFRKWKIKKCKLNIYLKMKLFSIFFMKLINSKISHNVIENLTEVN